jgi:outer membrane receptor protein involved in Fe transport
MPHIEGEGMRLLATARFARIVRGTLQVATRTCVLLIIALAVGHPLRAQVLYGSLTGNVIDQTGAVAVGARVRAVNVATGLEKTATTNDRGVYLFNDLPPGVYDLTIEATGFRPHTTKGIAVVSNAVLRADAQLEVSALTDSVEVVATAAPLQTDRADVHVTQTAREVTALPLAGSAGRNYQSLMQIVPGAVLAGEQNSAAGSPQRAISFNVNGVSRLQNNTRLDGASVVYPWLPTNTAYVPSSEAIEEVSIVTNSYNAEQGLAGGASINVVIKSGTNTLRGAAWGYNTDYDLRARNYFLAPTAPKPSGYLNQFGGNVGGPIARNQLFFFANWERTKREQIAPVRQFSLATEALRRGDFSGTGVTIYDPASHPDPAQRTPFSGNVIPADRIDHAAQEMIRRLPLPNGAGFTNNYQAQGTEDFKRDNIDFKVNYHPSGRLSLFGRYSYSPSDIYDPPALGEAGGDALAGGQLGSAPGRTHVAGFGATYAFGPSLVLDGNFGYTRQELGAEGPDLGTNFGLDVLRIPGTNGPDRLQSGQPSFQVNGWANMGNPNTGNPFQFDDKQYVFTVNVSWFRGSHGFRFGVDYSNQQLNHFQPQGGTFQTARGTFQFNGNATRLQNAPAPADSRFNSWADFLLGLPSGAGKVEQLRNPNSVYMQVYAAYAQDQWQITRDLTVTAGLRWEYYAWPTRGGGVGVSRFDPEDGNVYTGGLSGVPLDTGVDLGTGEFLPRIGAAYRLGERTVLRAGYGQSADPKPYIDFRNAYPINFAWSHPQVTFNGVTNPFIPVTTLRLGLDEAAFARRPDLSQGIVPLPPGAGTTTFPETDMRHHIHSWNVSGQRELLSWLTAQVAYVGTVANGQQGFININAGLPGTGNAGRPLARFGITSDINMIRPFGDTTYHALQTDVRARAPHALYGVVYTLSRTRNYADNDGNPRVPLFEFKELNRGPAGYDRTHNLQTYWVWDLPFGAGRRWATDGLAAILLGGWQVNGVMAVMSGTPINIIQGNSFNLLAGGSGQYPDQVKSDVETPGGVGVGNEYFDRSAYAAVNIPAGQPQRFGNSGRNPIRGPGFWNVDLGLFKTVDVGRVKVQFRAEALNALNHPNFSNPGGDISNAGTFGFITSTTGTGERNLRFGLRVTF